MYNINFYPPQVLYTKPKKERDKERERGGNIDSGALPAVAGTGGLCSRAFLQFQVCDTTTLSLCGTGAVSDRLPEFALVFPVVLPLPGRGML